MLNSKKRNDVIGKLSVFTAVPSRLSVKQSKYLEPLNQWLKQDLGVNGSIVSGHIIITNDPENVKRLTEAKTMANLHDGLFPVDIEKSTLLVDVRYY